MERTPKLIGIDSELGNLVLGLDRDLGTGPEASRMLLAEIDGFPGPRSPDALITAATSQDWGRKYLPSNGGVAYIDSSHLEVGTAEVLDAYHHVSVWHAMLRIVRRAMRSANARLGPDMQLQVLVNNSDGLSHSYGSHMNVLMTRESWNRLFHHRMTQIVLLATYHASSIVFTGQGKVGSENNAPAVDYQIAQRADFFEQILAPQTTYSRPIVNSRDESLCGPRSWSGNSRFADKMARLHCIFYDNTLCPVATLLKAGVLQIIVAMLEANWLDTNLLLDAPVQAVRAWSHDPDLRTVARLVSGERRTAVEMQFDFLAAATRFVENGGADGIVPHASEILALWEDTLARLDRRDFDGLAPRLDWVLKRQILSGAIERRPALGWASPELKTLDHLYGSLDEDEGLYWAYERAGAVESIVSEADIDRFVHEPPEDTRAWTRAMLLRAAGVEGIKDVNWDHVTVRSPRGKWAPPVTIEMPDPTGFTRSETQQIFEESIDLEEILERLRPSTERHVVRH